MASKTAASSCQKFCRLVVGKEASTLSILHGFANCVKNGTTRKVYPITNDNVALQCHPELLSVKFENLVHSIFRNENSTMEINVSFFGVLQGQQWQPHASVLVKHTPKISNESYFSKSNCLQFEKGD